MAIGGRAGDGLAGGHAIGCRAIFDAHLAADLLLQLRRECARQCIECAAFRRRHDQTQRLRRIPLQQSTRGRRQHRRQHAKPRKRSPPLPIQHIGRVGHICTHIAGARSHEAVGDHGEISF